ncbi:hypothetical protein VTJ83DRAFT_3412 [Remersonia thermophila]|uniref:Protein transport protein sec16 n=1 Tax=Remersonia thermophila TaxID=72144 RepID=A0ABR4DFE4_9PEZI
MASDAPTASWHPALMPNSTDDLPRATTATTQPVESAESPAEERPEPPAADASVPDDNNNNNNDELGGWADELLNEEEWPLQPEGEPAADVPETVEAVKTAEATEASQAAEATEVIEATGTVETAEAPESVKVVDTPEATESAEAAEAVQATEATEAIEATEIVEAVETAETVKTTESADSVGAVETPEATESAEATDSVEPDTTSSVASPATSKHFSTMSFTRTVAHEVNWNDDDDAEWTLGRTNSDPFKFMPDSHRTNSFPPVPPREEDEDAAQAAEQAGHADHAEPVDEAAAHAPLGQPVAFSHAEDVALDTEDQMEDGEPLPSAVMGTNQAEDAVQEAEEAARFEEGVPLIPAVQKHEEQHGPAEAGRDLFADDAGGEEDDFFSSVRNDAAPETQFRPPSLERKSTTDVLNSLNVGPASSGFAPLEETVQETAEEAVADAEPQQPAVDAPQQTSEKAQEQPKASTGEDLDAKWSEMFGDEEDAEFLADDDTAAGTGAATGTTEIDAAAFLGSDDEGLLEDEDMEQPVPAAPAAPAAAPPPQLPAAARYLPPNQVPAHAHAPAPAPLAAVPPPNPYLPSPSLIPAPSPALVPAPSPSLVPAPNPYFPAASVPAAQPPVQPPVHAPYTAPSAPPAASSSYGYAAAPPPPQEKKAQSFVDKAKGGYTSPYDLPMEVVKPQKRRTGAPPLQAAAAAAGPPVPPPPRSASLQAPPPPPSHTPPAAARPPLSHAAPPPAGTRKTSQENRFFEDLPISTKVRPASRQSSHSASSPTHSVAPGHPTQPAPPPAASYPAAPPRPPAPSNLGGDFPDLVAPPRVNPYASLTTGSALPPAAPPAPTAAASRYSPAPAAVPGAAPVPAPATSRYSPAPPAPRQPSVGYGPVPATPGPPILPHQPRTSSPLAHFEITNEKVRVHPHVGHADGGSHAERRSSGLHEFRLQRVPSLPPTTEAEEEAAPAPAPASQPTSPPVSRYAPPPQARQTPPPTAAAHAVMSPPKSGVSHASLASAHEFAPPPRSMTQSPGSLYGSRGYKPAEPIPRPSSANGLMSPTAVFPAAVAPPAAPAMGPWFTGRVYVPNPAIPPTDGRELDPLERWRGSPVVSWGVGGTLVTTFPKEVPRYGINSTGPSTVRAPGEVKVRNVKDIVPLESRLAKFPGPLKGKSKKKETIAWLSSGIESLEQALPTTYGIHAQLSHEDKRATERLLLWKILRVFIEHDGVLEGTPAVEKAVRGILCPGLETPQSEGAAPYANGAAAAFGTGLGSSVATGMQPDGVSSSAVEQIRRHLLNGEREKAIWAAADQRLWGHALLLSNALAPDLYKQVSQEFIKKEVNYPGHSNESLAALYEVLAGNQEESVDELVPSHARAGLQLVATNAATSGAKDAAEGLEKWRETLTLILSNRSSDDVRAINSLGRLLAGYGRAEAAHICFMFGRSQAVFGGLDDPASHFVLVGSDHKKQPDQFAKEIEPLLLSEVYEYGQSLASSFSVPFSNPHLAAYKLQHALALAEHGFRDKALQYCEALATAITSQTKRSPYHHPILENAVEDLMRRLKQAPKEESGSWIPKPSMNKVSDTMWSKFNKFVSGDDDADGQNSSAEPETGPFARIPGGTPAISRAPSTTNLESFAAAVPSFGLPMVPPNGPNAAAPPPPPQTRAASRYAPAPAGSSGSRPSTSAYAPRPSLEHSLSDMSTMSFEAPARRSLDMQQSGRYTPVRSGSPAPVYTPQTAETTSPQPSPYVPSYQPAVPQPAEYPAPENGVAAGQQAEPPGQASEPSYGYQPPSYGYEPPSLTPYESPSEEKGEREEDKASGEAGAGVATSTYEPPSFQPYSYEPPSYEPEPEPQGSGDGDGSEEEKPKPKKKGIMYDDDDDAFPVPLAAGAAPPKAAEKTKEERDRENAEMFRRIAEEEAKRAEAAKQAQAKKGWGFTSWFSRNNSNNSNNQPAAQDGTPGKPVKAKLGEPNSFYYDPELKRWVNKNAGPEDLVKKSTPPPPKASSAPRAASASPAPPPSASGPEGGRASAPPRSASHTFDSSRPTSSGGPLPAPVAMLRSASNTSVASSPPGPPGGGPPKPRTSLSTSNSIDDLLGAATGPRKPGAKKPKRGARYVDVMDKS